MPIIANVTDFDVTAAAAAFFFFDGMQPVIEMIDHDTKTVKLDLDQTIYITVPPVRYLSLDEQKTFFSAWRQSSKIRQVIKV